jgi:hypothetical protein
LAELLVTFAVADLMCGDRLTRLGFYLGCQACSVKAGRRVLSELGMLQQPTSDNGLGCIRTVVESAR